LPRRDLEAKPANSGSTVHIRRVRSTAVTLLDGHYRHRGASLVWDTEGLTISTPGDSVASHLGWSALDGVRQIGGRPGHVQLIVRNHVPPADPRLDPFSITVASDADAKRLVSVIGWRVRPQSPGIWGWRRRARI
jgi:hypothetical protein